MKVTMIAVAVGAFGTVPKGLVRKLEMLDIVRRAEIILETCCHSDSSEILSANVGVKNLQGVK